jgi:hypothetical protein
MQAETTARVGRLLLMAAAIVIAFTTAFLIYASRRPEAMLFYYGGAVEVPNGRAIAVMNPFRDTASEDTAGRLIRDLKSRNCESIVKEFSDDGRRICSVLQTTHRARLVWRQDSVLIRTLVYDIPEKHARLWIGFAREEGGWQVRSVSVVR